jgi:leader peptidase (prepilin peptidase) / N-methyltransferase
MPSLLTGVVLVALVVPAAVIDLRRRAIPDRLTLPGAIAALVLGAATGDPVVVAERVAAGAAAGGFLLTAALARPGAMGLGDVKLAGVLGLLLGPAVAVALLVALVAGTLAGGVVAARHGLARARRATIPFGPFLGLGAIVGFAAGTDLIARYLAAVG